LNHRLVEEARDELTRLSAALDLERLQVRRLTDELDARRSDLAAVSTQLRVQIERTADVQHALREAERRVAALETSWSWRLTGPGRRMAGWFVRRGTP
jgi:two-component sensor histidine kinase